MTFGVTPDFLNSSKGKLRDSHIEIPTLFVAHPPENNNAKKKNPNTSHCNYPLFEE